MPGLPAARALMPIGLLLFVSLGCASAKTKERTELRKRLEQLSQREAENNRRIEDLNTRLFLLEDKLDRGSARARVQRESAADVEHLPVVRLKPRHIPSRSDRRPAEGGPPPSQPKTRPESGLDREAVADVQPPRPGAEGTQSLVAAHSVQYDGKALRRQGSRPVLRLRGRGGRRAQPQRFDDTDIQGLGERLPVVPLASRKVAEALARATPRAKKDQVVAAYKKALEMYRERRLVDAVGGFQRLIDAHPGHDYVDNAMYWLAECFYDLKQYAAAAAAFERVVAEHPRGNKAPDALLKAGFSHLRMGKSAKGRAALRKVSAKYPGSRVAKLASDALSKLE